MNIDILYLTHLFNGILMIAIPVCLGIYLTHKFQMGWRLWWIGAATFTLSQVGHIPFNMGLSYLFQKGILPTPPENWSLIFNAAILGLSAGLWEECARYATYSWWAKDARSWSTGVMLGAGHGGIEAILLGILVLIAYFQLSALRNVDLSALVPPDQVALAQQQVTQYWSAPWYMSLLGAVERGFTIVTQIALSIMVLQVFLRKQIWWLLIAVLWHALLDGLIVGIIVPTFGIYTAEIAVGLSALINLAIIFALRTPEQIATPAEPPATVQTQSYSPAEVLETPEKLDNTKFM